MFEFFIALFGGIYYLSKYTNDKAKDKAYRVKFEEKMELQKNIRTRYEADEKLCRWAKRMILSGENYDKICEWFAEDLKYTFGTDWKSKLVIPHEYPSFHSVDDFPTNIQYHITWVYHLVLAKHGKIDPSVIWNGFKLGYTDEDVHVNTRFAECVELQLLNAGVENVRFALELSPYTSWNEIKGGNIKIESLCCYPTRKLWNDAIEVMTD